MNLVLKEEAELASGSTGAGWKGVVGILLQGQLTDAVGGFAMNVPGGSSAPVHGFVQCVVLDAGQYQLSNALDAFIGT